MSVGYSANGHDLDSVFEMRKNAPRANTGILNGSQDLAARYEPYNAAIQRDSSKAAPTGIITNGSDLSNLFMKKGNYAPYPVVESKPVPSKGTSVSAGGFLGKCGIIAPCYSVVTPQQQFISFSVPFGGRATNYKVVFKGLPSGAKDTTNSVHSGSAAYHINSRSGRVSGTTLTIPCYYVGRTPTVTLEVTFTG